MLNVRLQHCMLHSRATASNKNGCLHAAVPWQLLLVSIDRHSGLVARGLMFVQVCRDRSCWHPLLHAVLLSCDQACRSPPLLVAVLMQPVAFFVSHSSVPVGKRMLLPIDTRQGCACGRSCHLRKSDTCKDTSCVGGVAMDT